MTSRGAYKGLGLNPGINSLGGRIRAIRVAWGWSQRDLAKRLNTDQQQVSLYERGKTKPARATTALLAEFFGIPVEALESGDGFSIPDLPMPQTSKEMRHGPRVQLPNIGKADVVALKVGGTTFEPITPGEGKKLLDRLTKNGQRIWIVFEEH